MLNLNVHSSFFIALFRHLVSVGARACYRTSLEFCKLLLSLDPECDPTGVLLMLDFYAIRAGQHAWFLRLYEEWELSRNLSQLPNWEDYPKEFFKLWTVY